jgi:IS5 family transposase
VRADNDVVYADAGYQRASKRPDVADDPHLSKVEFRIAARKSKLAAMAGPDRAAESRKASVRAKVEHPAWPVPRAIAA